MIFRTTNTENPVNRKKLCYQFIDMIYDDKCIKSSESAQSKSKRDVDSCLGVYDKWFKH